MVTNAAMLCQSPTNDRPFSRSLSHSQSMKSLTSLTPPPVGEGVPSFVQAKAAFDAGYMHQSPRSTLCSATLGPRGLVEHSFINWREPGELVSPVRTSHYISPRYPRGAPHLAHLQQMMSPRSPVDRHPYVSSRPSTVDWASGRGGRSPYGKEEGRAMLKSLTARPFTAPELKAAPSDASVAFPSPSPPTARPGPSSPKVAAARHKAKARTAERGRRRREAEAADALSPRSNYVGDARELTNAAVLRSRERASEMRVLERQLTQNERAAAKEIAARKHKKAQRDREAKELARTQAHEWARRKARREERAAAKAEQTRREMEEIRRRMEETVVGWVDEDHDGTLSRDEVSRLWVVAGVAADSDE